MDGFNVCARIGIRCLRQITGFGANYGFVQTFIWHVAAITTRSAGVHRGAPSGPQGPLWRGARI